MRLSPIARIGSLIGDGASHDGKPHRALVWLAHSNQAMAPPKEWTHPDVAYEFAALQDEELPQWLPVNARVHRVSPPSGIAEIRRMIRDIDAADVMPLDFVLVDKLRKSLRRVCKSESIPIYRYGLFDRGSKGRS